MKKYSLLALLLATSLSSFAQIDFFQGSFDEAVAKAKAEDKIIFMDAYASWCGPCKWMAQNAFTDVKVGEFFNANFVNVKMDMEKGEGPEVRQKYPLRAYPTLMFIDGDGKLVEKVEGARGAEDLLDLGEQMYQKHDPNPEPITNVEEIEGAQTLHYAYDEGYFESTDGENWIESAQNHTVTFHFKQQRVDDYYIYIFDASRNISIALPHQNGNCMIKLDSGWTPLYAVRKQ